MRKMTWFWCVFSTWLALVAVNLGADYVSKHPDSFAGRCVVRGYEVDEHLAQTCKAEWRWLMGHDTVAPRMAAMSRCPHCEPAECPKPAEQPAPTPEAAPVRMAGRIVVEQDIDPVKIVAAPADEESEIADLNTPFDNGGAADLHMPYADENPSSDTCDDSDLPDWLDMIPWLKAAINEFRAFHQRLVPVGCQPESSDNPNLTNQCPGCQSTGECPYQHVCPARVPDDQVEPKDPNNVIPDSTCPSLEMQKTKGTRFEEKFEKTGSSTSRSPVNFTWLEKLRSRLGEDTPVHPEIDTTEFRPSDAYPYSTAPRPY